MTEVEAETYLTEWFIGDRRVFKYNSIYRKETNYVVICKETDNLYTIDKVKSSCIISNYTKATIKAALVAKELILTPSFMNPNRDYREDKTGGCYCGNWQFPNSPHSYYCPKWVPPIPKDSK